MFSDAPRNRKILKRIPKNISLCGLDMQKPADINDAQWRCVLHDTGHLLILAGPGTGKTHTLTHRILRLIPRLKQNEKILAITFTNKAAQEMRERLQLKMEPVLDVVNVSTFHSFCLQVLRQYFRHTNLPVGFRIASAKEIESLIRTRLGLTTKELNDLLEEISRWKSFFARQSKPARLKEYNDILRSSCLVDFDDLINETLILLSNNEKVAREIRHTYRYICVDEYQDLNAIQNAFLKEMVKDGVQLTAIGDPNQAIYGFRGSDPRFFHQFDRDFPDVTITMLRENYRSAENILVASGQVICASEGDAGGLQALAHIRRQGRLVIHEAPTDKAEAEFIVSQIENLIGGTSMFSRDSGRVKNQAVQPKVSFADIAIIYRVNAQKSALKQALERSGIPYQICADHPLSLSLEVIDAIRDHARIAAQQEVTSMLESFAKTPDGRAMIDADEHLMQDWEGIIRLSRKTRKLDELFDLLSLQKPEDHIDFHVEKVVLMTMHAAKGLEFPVIFIAGCEEGLLPLNMAGMQSDIPEERRLFYVGMTRAKEFLYMTYAKKRLLYGQAMNNQPSRFLADIEDNLKVYEMHQMKSRRENEQEDDRQLTLF
jgi:superfamily I DNA/RNA helicase